MTIRKDNPSISFSDVLSILFTVITIVMPNSILILFVSEQPIEIMWVKVIFIISLYLFLSLIHGDIPDVGDLITQILIINKEKKDFELGEQILLIKGQLEIFNDYFCKIFTEYRYVSKMSEKFHRIREEIKTVFYKILNGGLTPLQFVWDFAYIFYRIIILNNLFEISTPIDIMISIAFLGVLSLTSGKTKGLGKLVGDILANSRLEDEKEQIVMGKIIHTIRMLCLGYSRVTKHIENLTGMEINDFIAKAIIPVSNDIIT